MYIQLMHVQLYEATLPSNNCLTYIYHKEDEMRVTCKCGTKGAIRNSKQESVDVITIYCQCLDVHCGHTWVAHLTFSHTLKEPANSQLVTDAAFLNERKQ